MGHVRREFTKLLFQKRTYIGWGGLLAVPFIVAIAITLTDGGPSHGDRGDVAVILTRSLTSNGLYLPIVLLSMLGTFFIPLLASVAGGQALAGEAEKGTLRTLLMQPVKRSALLGAKWLVANVYMILGLAVLGAAALLAGALFFGLQPLRLLSGEMLGGGSSALRILIAYGYVFAGTIAVVSLALLLSTLTDSSLTAVAGALVLVIVMLILQQFSAFDFLRPYLLSSHLEAWTTLLRQPVDWTLMWKGLANFAAWSAGTTGVALFWFRRKDILS